MTGSKDVRALTPAGLADLAVTRVASLLGPARQAGVAVRLAVDGAVEAETAAVADAVAAAALATGTGVVRVRAADFLHRRSVRLEWGPHDVDAAFERWVDWASLQREVLDPLADPTAMTWLPRLRDAATDRSAREPLLPAAPGALLVVDGPYLLRWELSGSVDAVVHLLTSPAALSRRFPDPGDPRPGAWARYVDECDPAARADLVVRHDHPARPALLG
ncbi:hypothetical protein [Jannaschia sp. R86511]|uniref:hypothetical protein n=1 Tax=Jannaschia sp. R86511 TaxID=3093853 RepID=UPI0036D3CCBC